MQGKWPGIIRKFDTVARQYRVEIPGVTDGADVLPLAEMEYPIGDKSKHEKFATEIEILEGDKVWLEFERGDPRYPIITGYRNDRSVNSTEWRRWHHANIELNAGTDGSGDIYLKAGARVHIVAPTIFAECEKAVVEASDSIEMTAGNTVMIKAGTSITLDAPDVYMTMKATVSGLFSYLAGLVGSGNSPGGGAAQITGSLTASGEIKSGDIGLTSHHHTAQGSSAPTTPAQA